MIWESRTREKSAKVVLVLFASLLRLGDQLLSQSDIHVLDKPSLAIGLVVFGLRWLAMCHISHISLMLLGSHPNSLVVRLGLNYWWICPFLFG